MSVFRINLEKAFDRGNEIVSIVETDDLVRFAIATRSTSMPPPVWGIVLADLLRDMAAGLASRGVVVDGRELDADEVLEAMVASFTAELAGNTDPGPLRLVDAPADPRQCLTCGSYEGESETCKDGVRTAHDYERSD